jgi:hypothetical protein
MVDNKTAAQSSKNVVRFVELELSSCQLPRGLRLSELLTQSDHQQLHSLALATSITIRPDGELTSDNLEAYAG